MKIAIVINKNRMTPELAAQLEGKELTTKYNITYDVFILEAEDISDVIEKIKSQPYNAVLIGGGDGTVRLIAEALIDTNKIICILPLGTFNILAKTLNYPNNINELFAIIKNGKTKHIDLIRINDKIVINHAWIGFYFYMLKQRKKYQSIIGKNKLLKIIFNSFNLFRILPIYHLEFKTDNKETSYQTCLVYIGNNEFSSHAFSFDERQSLSSGLISVTILNCQTRYQLFLCMLSYLFNKVKYSQYIIRFTTSELLITAKSNSINIVLDGDLFRLNTPLQVTNENKKLEVYIP